MSESEKMDKNETPQRAKEDLSVFQSAESKLESSQKKKTQVKCFTSNRKLQSQQKEQKNLLSEIENIKNEENLSAVLEPNIENQEENQENNDQQQLNVREIQNYSEQLTNQLKEINEVFNFEENDSELKIEDYNNILQLHFMKMLNQEREIPLTGKQVILDHFVQTCNTFEENPKLLSQEISLKSIYIMFSQEMQKKINQEQLKLEQKDQENQGLQQKLQDFESNSKSDILKYNQISNNNQELKVEINEIENQIKQYKKEQEAQKQNLEDISAKNDKLSQENKELTNQITQIQNFKNQNLIHEQTIEQLNKNYQSLELNSQNQFNQMVSNKNNNDKQFEILCKENDRLQGQIQSITNEKSDLAKKLQKEEFDKQLFQSQLQIKSDSILDFQKTFQKKCTQYEDLLVKHNFLQKTYDDIKSQQGRMTELQSQQQSSHHTNQTNDLKNIIEQKEQQRLEEQQIFKQIQTQFTERDQRNIQKIQQLSQQVNAEQLTNLKNQSDQWKLKVYLISVIVCAIIANFVKI